MFFTILHWDLGKDLGVSGDFFFFLKVKFLLLKHNVTAVE